VLNYRTLRLPLVAGCFSFSFIALQTSLHWIRKKKSPDAEHQGFVVAGQDDFMILKGEGQQRSLSLSSFDSCLFFFLHFFANKFAVAQKKKALMLRIMAT